MSTLLRVSLRQGAVFIPDFAQEITESPLSKSTATLIANLASLGFDVSESLLRALNQATRQEQVTVLDTIREVMRVDANWTPLVKGWDVPTGETSADHRLTLLATAFSSEQGTRLPCGHLILPNTFPLERYNGCPFCGTPFTFGQIERYGQGSKRNLLNRWTESDIKAYLKDLLASKTPLDATQVDSLKLLLQEVEVPVMSVGMKETLMLVIDTYVSQQPDKAASWFQTPNDILRYLWYKRTGFLQLSQRQLLIGTSAINNIGGDGLMKQTRIVPPKRKN